MGKLSVYILKMLMIGLIITGCNDSNVSNNMSSSMEGEDEIVLSLGNIDPISNEAHFYQGIMKFEELVDEKSDGDITLDIHMSSVLGGEREMIESVQMGALDMALTSTGPLGNFERKILALDFPFLFRDREHAHSVLDGEIGDELTDKLKEHDLYNLAWFDNGWLNYGSSTRPINSPSDLEGLDIRTMENEVYMESAQTFGANPTPMGMPELVPALQQGVIDGTENPATIMYPSSVYEPLDYLSISEHYYQTAPLLINKNVFGELHQEMQNILIEAAEEARDYQRDFVADAQEAYVEEMSMNGLEIVTDIETEKFIEASEPLYEMYEDEFGDIHGRIRNK